MKSTTYTEITFSAESKEDALSNLSFIATQARIYDTVRVMIEHNATIYFSCTISKRYKRYTWANFVEKHSNGTTFTVMTPEIVREILGNA